MQDRSPHRGQKLFVPVAALALLLSSPPGIAAQAQPADFRFEIDQDASLAWYQVNPHTSLLWATTCPQDPFWRAGESRNEPGGTRGLPLPKTGMAMMAEKVIPLWQRPRAQPICRHAVHGEFTATDTISWKGVKGTVLIRPDSLYSGLRARDRTANADIFGVALWPEIRFEVDSLGSLVPGDTVRGYAYGKFFFRNVETPTAAPIQIFRESPAGLRILARVEMVPTDLVEVYGVSIHGVRLGLSSGGWQMIHFGVDAILKPTP